MNGAKDATPWEQWQLGWQAGVNQVQWSLRNFLTWAPGTYREPTGQKLDGSKHPLAQLPTEVRDPAESLLTRYGLAELPQRASTARLMETLTYLDWLDGMAQTAPEWFQLAQNSQSNPEDVKIQLPLRWLDVGAKNWAYVEALAAFLQTRQGQSFQLDGVELDPHRRYTNWQTRGQAAQTFCQAIPQATYHTGDIQDWRQPADIISLFLPFVFVEPHLAWGLPLDYFQPSALLNHVLSLLKPGGVLIVVNQGEVEAQAQAELFQTANTQNTLEIQNLGQLTAPFMNYQHPRHGWLCRKKIG